MKYFFAFIFSFYFVISLSAQVFSPDLLCFRNDTLYWDNPVNNCGSFISHDIYSSDNPTGPFMLLASINDANQTNFFDNISGGLTYYYMEGVYNCPGEMTIYSDTLDNLQAPRVPIETATVIADNVQLSWSLSNAPEVIGYIIFRRTSVGVVPIDTVFGTVSTYLDLDAEPNLDSESYFILALDNCGGTSVFDEEHRTIFLNVETEDCDDFIQLDWSEYLGWSNIETYEIWLSENQNLPEKVAEVDGSTTNFNFPEPTNENVYCFFIKGIEAGTGVTTDSNITCDTVNVSQPVRDFVITNVSVNNAGETEVTWTWDGNATLDEYFLNQGLAADELNLIFSEIVSTTLPEFNTYTDSASDPNASKLFYTISLTDDCGNEKESAVSSTIFAQGEIFENGVNQISWTDIGVENAQVDFYEIYQQTENGDELIGTTTNNENVFTYQPELAVNTPSICYYVVAHADVTLFDGRIRRIQSRSNLTCIPQNTIIHVPNAFAPQGRNREFRPVLTFTDGIEYEMQIFDRYGKQIFLTQDLNEGWNGYTSGRIAPQGVYVYRINITQANGRTLDRQGTLMLLK